MNAAFTALEAKDGGLTWKQAALKVGIDAAITSVTWGAGQLGSMSGAALKMSQNSTELMKAGFTAATSTALGTLGSCVQYNMDGSISWDQRRFHDNKTWSQAGLSFATSFGTQAISIGLRAGVDVGEGNNVKTYSISSNLVHTAISSTLGTLSANIKVEGDGGWDWQGFENIDGQKALIEGTASYVASTATGGMRNEYMRAFSNALIGAYVKKGVSELFEHYGGRDFGDTFSLDKPITVDTLAISTRQSMDALMDYFANDGKKTLKVVEKVPKYVKKREYVFEKPAISNGNKFSFSDLGTLSVPKTTIVEKTVQEGFEDRERTIELVDNRTMGEKLVDGFVNAFKGFTTIGASFAQEWQTIKNDASTLGTALSAGFAYAWEGARNLVNMAVNGVKNLFGGSEVKEEWRNAVNKEMQLISEKSLSRRETEIEKWRKKSNLDLKGEGKDLDVRIIEQTWLTRKACVFYSRLMAIEEKTGQTINPDKALDQGIRSGSMKAGYYVNDANKLASENGLKGEVLHPTIYGSAEKLTVAMLEQFEKGNPVMVLIGDSKGNFNHMEVAKGYEFDSAGNLRILLADPGFQDDKYLDVTTMQPYKYNSKGEPEYSKIINDYGISVENRRKVYGINYYEKKNK